MIYPSAAARHERTDRGARRVHSETNFGPQWEHLTLNFKNAILADQDVREAITWGIDRQALVDTLMMPFSADAVGR